jgi:parallel beta-helix repeat protein
MLDITIEITRGVEALTIYVDDDYGSEDATHKMTIQAGINAAQPGDTVFVYNGTYYENVVVGKTINLTGINPNNTTINGNGNGDVIYVSADRVNITGFTVTGSGNSIGYAGIELNNVQNCKVFNNIASGNRHGILLDSSERNNITSNNISSNTECGIYFKLSNWNNIIGNNISNNKEGIEIRGTSTNNSIIANNISLNTIYGIYLWSSGWNTLKNNSMTEDGIYILGGELQDWNTHDIDTSNTVNGKPIYYWKNQVCGLVPSGAGQIILANCTNVSIQNQELNNGSVGLELGFSSYNRIIGNKIQFNERMGIRIFYSDWNKFKWNHIDSNGYEGIYGTKSKNNIFKNNTITSNGEDGIELQNECLNNIFSGNDIRNNKFGIYVAKSHLNEFINNELIDNQEGLHVFSLSNSNNLSGNLISSSTYGIFFDSTYSNIIFKNELINNTYGMYILSTANTNLIYNNNFLNNTVQAVDNTNNNNQWDNGYPSGGNYWSDYNGIDLNETPTQDVPPPDGIGDTPYIIDPDSQDDYPWMEPFQGTIHTTPQTLLPPILFINVSSDGKDIILNWEQQTIQEDDPYLIYRSTNPNDFDFSTPWVNTLIDKEPGELSPIPDRTMWNDTNAANTENITNYQDQYYYIIRAFNDLGEVSSTSRTVGKWTKVFPEGISTFSFPLTPIEQKDMDFYTTSMNAEYIKYIDPANHTWKLHNSGDGGSNNTDIKQGEGYEVKLASHTNYTFLGMPGAMISYDNDTGFEGFNSSSESKNITLSIESGGNVTISWQEPISMSPGGWYEIYYSHRRDGFFGAFNEDYFFACSFVTFGNNSATHYGAQAYDPGTRLYYMVVPYNACGVRGVSTYSIGIWTEEYLSQYDTFGIPLKSDSNQMADWYCDNIPNTVGINYFNVSSQRWSWHSERMNKGAFDPVLVMGEGYQISTSSTTKFTFIGI